MIDTYKVLAIIPARGGSKGIPKKNIKPLAGKPLIGYAIDEAKKSKYIDRIVTSTDSKEIANVARELGSEVPFMRPSEISGDTAVDYSLFKHALEWFAEHENYKPDIIVQLRPTSPLRTVHQIDAAIELLVSKPDIDSVRTVTEPAQTPYKMYTVDDGGLLVPILPIEGEPESINWPRQKLPKAYKHSGYVDVVWYRTLIEKGVMTGTKIAPLILDDALPGINNLNDWEYYETLIELRDKKQSK